MVGTRRTHTCGELNASHAGTEVVLCGWVLTVRDHGGLLFADLRDRYGVTQVVFSPENAPLHERAAALRSEFVISVRGQVAARPKGMENPKLATGDIEVHAADMDILNKAETPPFEIDAADVATETRLKYRYMDLRRAEMQRNLIFRHRLIQCIRRYFDEHGFIDIETPIMIRSTPGGARNFLVPSRLNARLVLRAGRIAAALQADPHGRRHGPLRPDREVLPRRRPALRPAAGVHATGRGDVLRRPGPDRRADRRDDGAAFSATCSDARSGRRSRA